MAVPDEMIADIKCKLLIILINLNAMHLTKDLVDTFLEADPEEFGDLMVDISEALLKNKNYEEGVRFFELLVNSQE